MADDSDLIALGHGIRACREQLGLSQEELAGRAGMHRNYVGLLERGERNASAKTLIKLARTMGLSPGALWQAFSDK